MPTAYSLDRTPVVNLGGGRHDYLAAALSEFGQSRKEDEARKLAIAQVQAQEFGKRIAPYADRPDLVQQAASEFVKTNPDAAPFIAPYVQNLPQTDAMGMRTDASAWLRSMAPAVEKAFASDPSSVNPHLLSLMRPFFSNNDKSMEPHEYEDLRQQYTYSHPGELPSDYVTAQQMKDKLVRTPQEIAQEATTARGQDVGLQGKMYESDQSLAGTKYTADTGFAGKKAEIAAQAPLRAAEAGAWGERGRMWGSRADVNDAETTQGQIDNHPLIVNLKQRVAEYQARQKEALVEARTAINRNPKGAAAAQQRADEMTVHIRQAQKDLADMTTKMRGAMGMEEEEPDAGGGADEGETAAPAQPQIRDMRGSTVPSRPAQTPAPPAPSSRAPGASLAPQPQAGAQVPAGGIDRARKIITKSALQQLQQKTGQTIDTTGWTVLPQ